MEGIQFGDSLESILRVLLYEIRNLSDEELQRRIRIDDTKKDSDSVRPSFNHWVGKEQRLDIVQIICFVSKLKHFYLFPQINR